jgi:hypothetical protein
VDHRRGRVGGQLDPDGPAVRPPVENEVQLVTVGGAEEERSKPQAGGRKRGEGLFDDETLLAVTEPRLAEQVIEVVDTHQGVHETAVTPQNARPRDESFPDVGGEGHCGNEVPNCKGVGW